MKRVLFSKTKIGYYFIVAIALSLIPLVNAHAEFGVLVNRDASDGYTLITSFRGTSAYLIDNQGKLINSWPELDGYSSGAAMYLNRHGNLVRALMVGNDDFGAGGGIGGLIREYGWDGNIVWQYAYNTASSDTDGGEITHHTITPGRNGSVLITAYERKTQAECDAAFASGHLPADARCDADLDWEHFIEVMPNYDTGGGQIVWEWHLWDQLLTDEMAANEEVHPELWDPRNRLGRGGGGPNFNHVEYDPYSRQILISCNSCSELFIIERGWTTQESAGHKHGLYGKGGDFLYRWGNPGNFGVDGDRALYGQHGVRWIQTRDQYGWEHQEDIGDILAYNNGVPGGSQVIQITPPKNVYGSYDLNGESYGPDPNDPDKVKRIGAGDLNPVEDSISSPFLSNPQPLAHGHLLINAGAMDPNTVWEVDKDLNIVWKFVNPVFTYNPGGTGGGGKCADGYIAWGEGGKKVDEEGNLANVTVAELFPDPDGEEGWLTNGTNWMFRATRYSKKFSGFYHKDMTPGNFLAPNTTIPAEVCAEP